MELVMTIYKNTKVIDQDGNDVDLS
jgi:uncharacterized protein YnzC (UPF0291/DUF896 family)